MTQDNPYAFLGGAPEESESSAVGILVFAETEGKQVTNESLAAVGKARELADMLGSGVGAVLFDSGRDEDVNQLIHCGADKIFLHQVAEYDCENYCSLLEKIVRQTESEIFLFPKSDTVIDFLPRFAQRMQTGLISGCIAAEIDTMDRTVQVTRPTYDGKMHEIHVCDSAHPQMIMLKPATFPEPIADEFRSGAIEKI